MAYDDIRKQYGIAAPAPPPMQQYGAQPAPAPPPNPYMSPPPQAMQQQYGAGYQIPQQAPQGGGAYTDAQVKQFIGDKGIGSNPYAMYAYAQKYGVQPDQVDRALGATAGQSAGWMQQQGLPGIGQQGQPQQPQQPPNPYMPPAGQGGPPPWANANPATAWMANSITQQVNNNLQRNILPGIGRNAVAAGGFGGSRQGVAEGQAIGDSMTGLSGALAGLYSGQFNQDRNYGLNSDALDLNVYNANQNWMRTGQQDQLNLVDRMLGWNQTGLNTATQAQNTPLNYYQQFMNAGTQLGGMGGSSSTPYYGNPLMGAVGGAQLATNVYNSWNQGK